MPAILKKIMMKYLDMSFIHGILPIRNNSAIFAEKKPRMHTVYELLRSTKCALYEIESIIKSLVNSNSEKNIYTRRNFRRTIKEEFLLFMRLFLSENGRVVTNECCRWKIRSKPIQ